MMKEEGKYTHIWLKYAAVIFVLLKKTEIEAQKLKLYKHEFEHSGRQNANITFTFNLINGRALNIVSSTTIARDLWRVLDNYTPARDFLKDKRIKVSIDSSLNLNFEKIESTEKDIPVETINQETKPEVIK